MTWNEGAYRAVTLRNHKNSASSLTDLNNALTLDIVDSEHQTDNSYPIFHAGRAAAIPVKNGGTGAGVSTYPFGLTSLKAHSAGGGGGGAAYRWANESVSNAYGRGNGCPGGTNGSDGSSTANPTYGAATNAGGDFGGGDGKNMAKGGDATFYGSGGGGGASNFEMNYDGGSGYQGVVYILIKK